MNILKYGELSLLALGEKQVTRDQQLSSFS